MMVLGETDTAVMISKLPACDFCGCKASYDAKSIYGPWAYMCEGCWQRRSYHKTLGEGKGQLLVVKGDA